MQLGIEMGWPLFSVFVVMLIAAASATTGKNIVSGAVMLAVIIQSMTEFQFYLPAVNLVFGLALAWHLSARKETPCHLYRGYVP
jgi:hypothetical protein